MNVVTRKETLVIGPEARFYGYIAGLDVEVEENERPDRRFHAVFGYNGEYTMWIVPDAELFKLLTDYLWKQAACIQEKCGTGSGEYKLWIERKGDKWIVELS